MSQIFTSTYQKSLDCNALQLLYHTSPLIGLVRVAAPTVACPCMSCDRVTVAVTESCSADDMCQAATKYTDAQLLTMLLLSCLVSYWYMYMFMFM